MSIYTYNIFSRDFNKYQKKRYSLETNIALLLFNYQLYYF